MSTDGLNQTAKFLVDYDTKVSEESVRRLSQLTASMEVLFNKSSEAAKNAAKAFSSDASEQNIKILQAEVGKLSKAMKGLNTTGQNVSLFSDNEITKVLALSRELAKYDKARQQMLRNEATSNGTLGLGSNNTKQQIKDLADLERAQRALAAAILASERAGLSMDSLAAQKVREDKLKLVTENIAKLKEETAATLAGIEAEKKAASDRKLAAAEARRAEREQAAEAKRQRLEDAKKDAKDKQEMLASYLKQKDDKEKQQELNSNGTRREAYRQLLTQQKQDLMQHLEERERLIRSKTLAQNQQAKEFLGFNPNTALRTSFGDTNPQGASTFQRIGSSGTVPAEQIAAQKAVLELQQQIVERMRQKLPIDQAHEALIQQLINAKRQEALLNTQNLQHLREQEAAQRRLALASGVGGASLLMIQTALRANSLILNGVQNALSQAVRSSVAVEAEFKNVQAVTATTNTEMLGLEETIKRVASSTKFSSVEVAQAALILGQAGLSASETAKAIPSVATLATAAGTSLAQAVSLTTSVLGIFDKQASETADIANKITQAANSSKVSVEKLALGFQYAGNIAHQSGVSFEETTAAMAAMSNAGILNGSTLGSGLRSFLTEVQKPSQEFIGALSRIGLGLSDVDFKAHGLLGVTTKLREAGFVANDAIKSFDIRGAAAFNALVANPADLERQYTTLLDTNAATKANEIQMDSLMAQSKRLQTSLENLAASGFAPLSTFLKDSASNLADFINMSSGATTTLGFMGTALAVVAAAGTAKFAVSLAAGTMQLLAFEAATVASVRAIGTMTVAQGGAAIFAGLTAGVNAVRGGLAALTLSLALSGTSLISFQGILATTGLAVRSVGTALLGMSLLTGVGVALAALAAGYYLLQRSAGASARAIDEAAAAASEAKAAYDAKIKTVASLDESLKSLAYRQNMLKDGSAELRMAVAEANNKFGDQIKIMDVGSTSAETLTNTLRGLRTEMQGIANINLDIALEKATKLQALHSADATYRVKDLDVKKSVFGSDKASDALAEVAADKNNAKLFKELGINPVKFSQSANAIRTGNTSDGQGEALSAMPEILSVLLSRKDFNISKGNRYRLEQLAEEIPQARSAIVSARQSSNEVKGYEATKDARKGLETIKASKYGKGTVDEALVSPGAIVDRIKSENPEADKVALFQLTSAAVEKAKNENLKLVEELKRRNTGAGDARTANATSAIIEQVNKINSELEGQRKMALNDAEPLAKRRDTEAKLLYSRELTGLKKQPKSAARDEKMRVLEATETKRALAYKDRGLVDPDDIAESRAAAEQAAHEKLQNDLLARNSTRAKPNQRNSDLERTAKLNERAELAGASSDKALADWMDDYDEVTKLLESGKAHILKAGGFAKEALKAKQAEERSKAVAGGENLDLQSKEFTEQNAAVETKTREDLVAYIAKFEAMGHAGTKHIQALTRSVKEKQTKIEGMKIEAEEARYDAGASLRGIERQQTVRGNLPEFVGREGTLEQQANRERLKINKIDSEMNAKMIETIGDESQGLISEQIELLRTASNSVKMLEEKMKDLQAKIGGLSGDEKAGALTEIITTGASLDQARKAKVDQTGALKSSYGTLKGARKTEEALALEQDALTQKIPVEFTFENMTKTLGDGVKEWRQASGNLDVMKTMADGMTQTFATATNSIGSGFRTILDGTKSVKEGFKAMGFSIVETMLNVATQMLAQKAIMSLFSMFGGAAMGAAGAAPMDISSTGASALGSGAMMAATGGYINRKGNIERVQHFASGGSVVGGVQGRDSVPAMLMPNEFVLNTKAVDSVGTDFLHSLNAQTNSVVSSSSPSRAPATSQGQQGNVVNVWVVSPDQQPTMGASDIVAVVGDNINRGGSIKKLIKAVQMGQA